MWVCLGAYVATIYATVPFVTAWRKTLVEAFGYGIYDWILWIFVPPVLAVLVVVLRYRRGQDLARSLIILLVVAIAFGGYMLQLKYPIERLHFAQYGLLGGFAYFISLRRGGPAFSGILALLVTYLAGLGDEWIQSLSPNRVGEISDAGLNVLSGLFGIIFAQEIFQPKKFQVRKGWVLRVRLLQGIGVAAVGLTLLFMVSVHGFGYRIESLESGIFYSAFSESELKSGKTSAGKPLITHPAYLNEGDRHLFQREFYCENDFLAADGSFYRNWSHCWMENAVLARYYAGYLEKFSEAKVGSRLKKIDRKFSEKVADNPVVWSEETAQAMQSARPQTYLITSRVKGTLLTETTFHELALFSLMAWMVIAWAGAQVIRLIPNED